MFKVLWTCFVCGWINCTGHGMVHCEKCKRSRKV